MSPGEQHMGEMDVPVANEPRAKARYGDMSGFPWEALADAARRRQRASDLASVGSISSEQCQAEHEAAALSACSALLGAGWLPPESCPRECICPVGVHVLHRSSWLGQR